LKHLLLAGGGHAHLFVLRKLAQSNRSDLKVTLVSPSELQYYSGMLPGWIAGCYQPEECRIDLRLLVAAGGVEFIKQSISSVDADEGYVRLSDGSTVAYDLLSLDVGGESNSCLFKGTGNRVVGIKPFSDFRTSWLRTLNEARPDNDYRLVIIGGGAAGVELAFAMKYSLPDAHVSLISGERGVLHDHGNSVRRRVMAMLRKFNINVVCQRAVGIDDDLLLENGKHLEANRIIVATGTRAPTWLTSSKLRLDAHGFIAVDRSHRSLSHQNVFAAGDVCSRSDVQIVRSGVHAVKAGPVLAHNLIAAVDGKPLIAYRPRRHTLYLLACGRNYAIASWGNWSAEGKWVWDWKNWIDRRFVRKFS
jgi:pyridine nucleotide-disulfide oxidoreductase family protein